MSKSNFTPNEIFTKWSSISNPNFHWIRIEDDKYRFLKSELIDRVFPSLKLDDQQLLLNSVVLVLNFIHLKFGFGSGPEAKASDLLWNQLVQNNLLDLRAILNTILPFIMDNEDDEKKHSLKKLEDLYLTQNKEGKFVYTNSQYNRCVRINKPIGSTSKSNTDTNSDSNTQIKFRPFLKEYFLHNLELFMMSIESIANKLYVNWTNIIPFRMDNYQQSNLFVQTLDKIKNPDPNLNLINSYIDPNPGLSYSDIYNTISNHLFSEIVNLKWMIYDITINAKPVSYINYLESQLYLDPIWSGKMWSQITDSESSLFQKSWIDFFDSKNIIANTVFYQFYYFFAKYHKNRDILVKQNKLLSLLNEYDEDREEYVDMTAERIRLAKSGLTNVPAEEIYTFFYDSIVAFKKTWYYYFMKIMKKTYLAQVDNVYITPKNIYNYCKSFVHFVATGSRYTQMPKHWISLKKYMINDVIGRLMDINDPYNNWSKNNWFNINKSIKRSYPNIPANSYPKINQLIHLEIKKNLAKIIFESLIYHGLLSDFVPEPSITNVEFISNTINTTDENKIREFQRTQIKSKHFSTNRSAYENYAYYFLTSNTYGSLPKYQTKNSSKKYFDYLSTEQIWTFTYAMNWVSQFNFFHKYINTRVMYITGSTGVGKSTQTPKLLMYAQKMIDFNPKGKIVCTQPRIRPTESNTVQISNEMGVGIRSYNKTYDRDVYTDQYSLQFKHSEAEHVAKTDSFLRIVTDGTLLTEVKSSPFLTTSKKDMFAIDKNNQPISWAKKFSSGNTFDIVIVDEAHEHNPNMDIILTLVRDAVYVNNSLKLVIISATMEDDEPIYRRYYRKLNDNRAYPISAFIEQNELDRANVDRRIDISPPGKTTQFKITNHYLTEEESEKINEENFVEAGIDKTIDIVKTTIGGDILLFVTGIADIKKAVEEINRSTPSDTVAFGFYSQLPTEKQAFIMRIDKELKSYTRYKDDFELDEKDLTRRVPKGTYKRAVIIATNVAEASITITTLRYVVDTGYAKVVVYDPLEDINKSLILPISNSSSVQRKGRIGRVAPGDFYPLYSSTKLVNNKTAYKIADSNIKDTLIGLLKTDPDDIFIISTPSDINNIRRLVELNSNNNYQENLEYKLLLNPRPYFDIINKQYMYYPKRLIDVQTNSDQYYTYFGKYSLDNFGSIEEINELYDQYLRLNHDDYTYQINDTFVSRSYTGYDDFILQDLSLQFFIIHPDENIINRNLFTGRMISIKDSPSVSESYYYYLLRLNNLYFEPSEINSINFKSISNFILPKYQLTMDVAKLQSIVTTIPNFKFDTQISYTDISPNLNFFVDIFFETESQIANIAIIDDQITIRSQLQTNISAIQSVFSIDVLNEGSSILWYTFGLPYEIEKDILALLIMIKVCPDLGQWMKPSKNPYLTEKFINQHSNNKGDIFFLWNIWSELKQILSNTNLLIDTKIDPSLFSKYLVLKEKFLTNNKIDYDQYLIFSKMYQLGQINSSSEFYSYIKLYSIDFSEKIKKYPLQRVKIWTDTHGLNFEKVIEFLVEYLGAMFNINQKIWLNEFEVETKMIESIDDNIDLAWARKFLFLPGISSNPNSRPNTWDRIIESYIRANSANLIKTDGKSYLKISGGIQMDPSFWSYKVKKEKTLLTNKTEYLIYHAINSSSDEIYPCYLTPVQLEWVLRLNPIYYYYFFYDKTNILHRLEPDPDVNQSLSIIQKNAKYFSKSNLLLYLDKLNIKSISNIMHREINKYN